MSDKKVFAERVKAKRQEKQLSQAKLAKIIHVVPSAIASYEQGIAFPPVRICEELSRFFGVSIEWLIGAEENFSDKTKNDTESFLSAINSVINISGLSDDGGNIAILVPKRNLLSEYLQNEYFLLWHQNAMTDALMRRLEKFNQEAYKKYSVEELLKDNTSKKG